MARLPKVGELDWGDVLNEFLSQTLDSSGRLVAGATNPYHGGPNTNLANGLRAGMVSLTNDFGGTAGAPVVSGLQGKPVSSKQPLKNQVLAWNEETGTWRPTTQTSATNEAARAHAMAVNSVGL